MAWLLLGLFAAAVVVGLAWANWEKQNSFIGKNDDGAECADACRQWDNRRQEKCNAEAAENDWKEKVELLKSLLLAVVTGTFGLVAALMGSAALVALLSELGVPAAVAAVLLVGGVAIAIAGSAVSIALGAALVAATTIWASKQADTQQARNAEAEALDILSRKCPAEKVTECRARPSPC